MEIKSREHLIRICILDITGRLEAFTVADLRLEQSRRLSEGYQNFVVDLSRVDFIDSTGMSALVSLLKQSRQLGGEVVLVKPAQPAAYRILTLTRFDQVFVLVGTVEEAIRRF